MSSKNAGMPFSTAFLEQMILARPSEELRSQGHNKLSIQFHALPPGAHCAHPQWAE